MLTFFFESGGNWCSKTLLFRKSLKIGVLTLLIQEDLFLVQFWARFLLISSIAGMPSSITNNDSNRRFDIEFGRFFLR